jgi:hypothetical protein
MERNNDLQIAWDFVENTGRSIFLTGKAGTGKTTVLKTVVPVVVLTVQEDHLHVALVLVKQLVLVVVYLVKVLILLTMVVEEALAGTVLVLLMVHKLFLLLIMEVIHLVQPVVLDMFIHQQLQAIIQLDVY